MVKSNSVEDNNGREPPIYNSSKKIIIFMNELTYAKHNKKTLKETAYQKHDPFF